MNPTSKRNPILLAILALMLMALGCQSFLPAFNPTATPSLTPGPTHTPTLTPTATATPSPTPLPKGIITTYSCEALAESKQYGEGEVAGMALTGDGVNLLVWTDSGLSSYDLDSRERLWNKPNPIVESASLVTVGPKKQPIAVIIDQKHVIHFMDLATGEALDSWPARGEYMRGEVSPDARHFAILGWLGDIYIYQIGRDEVLQKIKPTNETFGETFYLDAKFTKNNFYLVVAALGGEVLFYQVSSGKVTKKIARISEGEEDDYESRLVPGSLAISEDSKTIAIEYRGDDETKVMVTSVADPQVGEFVVGYDPALSQKGEMLAVRTESGLAIYNTSDLSLIKKLDVQVYGPARFNRDGDLLIAATQNGLAFFKTDTGETDFVLDGAYSKYEALAVSPDGETLAALEQKQLSLISQESGETTRLELPQTANAISYSLDGSRLLLSEQSKNWLVWDIVNQQTVYKHTLAESVWLSSISLEGEKIATLDKTGKLQVLSLLDERAVEIKPSVRKITALGFAPGGEKLFAAVEGGQVFSWSASDGYQTETVMEAGGGKVLDPQSIAFFENGKRLVVIGDSNGIPAMASWNLETGAPYKLILARSKAIETDENQSHHFAMSPFGHVVYTGATDGNAGELIKPDGSGFCQLDDGPLKELDIKQLYFSPDGMHFFVLDESGKIHRVTPTK